MNENQIAFIICSNNAQYYNECVRYIQELKIPEEYSTDIICVQEADSMAQGYNAGMRASDARYKVYLHHDTFILNQNFIYDILNIFKKDEMIGMLGVIGARTLPADAKCYLEWNIGNVRAYDGRVLMELDLFQISEKEYIEVNAVDGLIMITQYDIPWREDFLDGWDFYDISQSLEMKKNGYKVAVPYQKTAWCYHDCGVSKLKTYDDYRKKMIGEYPEFFRGEIDEEIVQQNKKEIQEVENIQKSLIQLLEKRKYEMLNEIIERARSLWILDTQIREIVNLMEIYSLERDSISGKHSEWMELGSWGEIYEYYNWIRHVLLWIEQGREDERAELLKEKVRSRKISRDAIRKISNITLLSTSNVYQYLLKEEKKEPLVSVMVPVYNSEEVMRETLDCILQQTYCNLEIIVVGDAGLRQASGKYIAVIDHNNLWKSDKLEKQISFLEEHPTYSACFTWADIIDKSKNITSKEWGKLHGDNLGENEWSKKLRLDEKCFYTPSACIRKEFLEKTEYYPDGLAELPDNKLWLRLLCEGTVYILQEELVYCGSFREQGESLRSWTGKKI